MKRVSITKSRDKKLHIALCLDDYLYEKFRRYENELQANVRKYLKNPQRIWEVIRKTKDGYFVKEQIIGCEVADFGTRIIIEDRSL